MDVDETGWQQQAATFSDYVYSCVWDYAVVFAKPALVQAQNAPAACALMTKRQGARTPNLRDDRGVVVRGQ